MPRHSSSPMSAIFEWVWRAALLTRMSTGTESLLDLGEGRPHRGGVGELGMNGDSLAAGIADTRHDRLGIIPAATVVDRDSGAGLGEAAGDARADAGGSAGDQGDLAGQVEQFMDVHVSHSPGVSFVEWAVPPCRILP